MPKVNTFNYDTIASWNGSQDLFVVEQPDGTKVATPAMVKQFIEAGNFTVTGNIEDGDGNQLADIAIKLGDPASASGVTGYDAFAKISALNSNLNKKLTGAFSEVNTALTAQFGAVISALPHNGDYACRVMYCSSANADFSTIGYCMAFAFGAKNKILTIIAINGQNNTIWTNSDMSGLGNSWSGWKKHNVDN